MIEASDLNDENQRDADAKCLNCKAPMAPWFSETSGFFECASCGLVARDPMPSNAALDAMYREYYTNDKISGQTTGMESSDTALEGHARYITAHMLSNKTRPGNQSGAMKILDYGAGTGKLVKILRANDYNVDGLEFSVEARAAWKQENCSELFSDLSELQPETYDVILMIEVIEHLPDPLTVLRALQKSLKPGGALYISTPNLRGLNARMNKQHWREAQHNIHLLLFRYATLRNILNKNNFVSTKYLRFSALPISNFKTHFVHRSLQFIYLYGGLRVVSYKPK